VATEIPQHRHPHPDITCRRPLDHRPCLPALRGPHTLSGRAEELASTRWCARTT
jgi:hypothetical protein